MEQPKSLHRGRSANLRIGQDHFLAKGMSDKLNIQDKLRVNIALKYMRKAHIEGSKADRERELLQREVFSRPKTGIELPYSDSGAISIRNIDDIIKDAKTGFHLIKEHRMEQKKSSELGNPKPIFKKLIDDIKHEFETQKNHANASKLRSSALIMKQPPPSEASESNQVSNTNTLLQTRPRSAPSHRSLSSQFKTLQVNPPSPLLTPLEGVAECNTNTLNTATTTPSNQSSSVKSKLWANIASAKSSSDEMSNHSNFDTAATFNLNCVAKEKLDRFGMRPRSAALRRSSSAFMLNLVDSDEQVKEALRRRNAVAEQRENLMLQKLELKENGKQMKEEAITRRERQLCWLVFVSLAARLSILRNKSLLIRDTSVKGGRNRPDKIFTAVHLIERWWRGKAVAIKIRKNPGASIFLATVINLFAIRCRLKKKNRSADLIKTFLRDSTGVSEVMGKIYVFRLNVIKIQRWIRMWIDIQINRMRVFWMLAEKISRALIKADNALQRKNERRMKASIAQVEGFSDTITEIGTVQKQLGKLLKEHETIKIERERNMEEFMKKKEKEMRQFSAAEAAMSKSKRHQQQQNNNIAINKRKNTTIPSTTNNTYNNTYNNNNNHHKHKHNETLIWWRRVRQTKTYETLRMILKSERKRHILVISRPKIVAKNDDKVSTRLVKRFLREPDNDNVEEMLTKSIIRESDQLLGNHKTL
mmetsp:Transcript_20174/g.27708  ORF Transcript_20174/g.27708 Transcript_20174/m.27708 type:complete len:703 (-) Transcript_20174:18-2126(-)